MSLVERKKTSDSEGNILGLSWCGIWEKRVAFDSPVQTRQPREELMAMINDKGPEESRDTAATYIIPSHQAVHLPGPSLQPAHQQWREGGREGEE